MLADQKTLLPDIVETLASAEILVKEGDSVSEGQIVAKLDI